MKHKIIIVMCILILLVGCSNKTNDTLLLDNDWDNPPKGMHYYLINGSNILMNDSDVPILEIETNDKLLLDNGSLFRIADTNITSMLFTQPQGIYLQQTM